jgi:hypothetical protein
MHSHQLQRVHGPEQQSQEVLQLQLGRHHWNAWPAAQPNLVQLQPRLLLPPW